MSFHLKSSKMAFLDYAVYARGYVNSLTSFCTELCETISSKITEIYPSTPRKSQQTAVVTSQTKPSSEKDDVRRINEQLCQECNTVQEDYKRLRGILEQLSREYEDSKDVDFFRRYGMLKGMIKRSVLHLKLSNDDHNQKLGAGAGKQKEEMRKREERVTGLTTQEITIENGELTEHIKEYRRKISMIKDLIENMDSSYEGSKRYIAIQRYRLMKSMIRTVIYNKWI